MRDTDTRNRKGGFYGAVAEIGRAVGRPDFADKLWDLAIAGIYEEAKDALGAKWWARAFLDGDDGIPFALTVVSRFPQGIMPQILDDGQLEQAVMDAVARWEDFPVDVAACRYSGTPHGMRFLDAAVLFAGNNCNKEEDEEVCCD